MPLSHEEVLSAACAGDAVALGRLVELYRDRVYHYGVRVCANRADADDAVQEAFGALQDTLRGLRGRASLSSWLFTIVKNACRRMLRPSQTRERLEHLAPMADEPSSPAEALERAQLADAVRRALGRLDPSFREVIVLRDVEGLSGSLTAARLRLSEEAMKSRLYRARQALKHSLADTVPLN